MEQTAYDWNNLNGYLQWLRDAYEFLKISDYVYDKREKRRYYNKPYWEFRFKMEIKRIERMLVLEQRIKMECEGAI
jgi:hypothetical protein